MDKLTVLAIAEHQPRRAMQVGIARPECAACCARINLAMDGASFSNQWEKTELAARDGRELLHCPSCSKLMEYHDAP